jgi:hypothetical protein
MEDRGPRIEDRELRRFYSLPSILYPLSSILHPQSYHCRGKLSPA